MTPGGIDAGLRRTLDEAWRLLGANGQGAAVQLLRQRLDADAQVPPTVVVIGEAKRGKSSLINALVGANVAPIGVDIVTGVYVSYVPLSIDHDVAPGNARVFFTDDTTEDIALEQLEDWVTVAGQGDHGDRGVVSATARLAKPGAVDMVLVDTPGVGSLVGGHGDVALRAAREATALIFVTDAGQDFTAPEKAFLETAAADIDSVIFVVTKIDKHPVTWRESVERDRVLLSEHAPRFADAEFVGVSSTMAAEAAADDSEVAEVLREESRLDHLVAVLTAQVSARAGELATLNALRGTVTALRVGMTTLDQRIAAVRSSGSAVKAVTAEYEELKALEKRSKRWVREFEAAANRARRALIEQLGHRAGDLEHEWRRRIADMTPAALRDENAQRTQLVALGGEVARVSGELLDQYTRDLSAEVEKLLAKDFERVSELSDQLAQLAKNPTEAAASHVELAPVAKQGLSHYLLRTGFMGVGMANLAGMAASFMGVGAAAGASAGAAGAVVGGLATLGPAAIPAVVAFGLGMAFKVKGKTEAEIVRSQLREHGSKTVQRMQQNAMLQADGIAAELRPLLADSMDAYIEQRAAQLNEVLAEAKKAARAEPVERQRRLQPLQKMRDTFSLTIGDLDATLNRSASGTSDGRRASKNENARMAPGPPS